MSGAHEPRCRRRTALWVAASVAASVSVAATGSQPPCREQWTDGAVRAGARQAAAGPRLTGLGLGPRLQGHTVVEGTGA
eukprot:2085409-Lingulodinium_polyedra.AAC.2